MTFFFVEKGSQIFCYFSAYDTRKNRLNLLFREFSVSINAQKMKFSLRISSVNVTKCAENCEFGHLLKKSLMENFILLCSVSEISLRAVVRTLTNI